MCEPDTEKKSHHTDNRLQILNINETVLQYRKRVENCLQEADF